MALTEECQRNLSGNQREKHEAPPVVTEHEASPPFG